MVTVTYRVTKFFFDRAAVLDRADKASIRVLSKAGAFVRQAARTSIRRRKGVSKPGSPPSAHSTDKVASLKNILFAYEPQSRGVVIGPVALNAKSVFGGSIAGGVVPPLMEYGGTQGIVEQQYRDGTWHRADLRSRRRMAGRTTRIRQARYQPRPFMGPAMRRELPKFPGLWANSLERAA